MLIGLLRQLAKLPLSWIHAVGGTLGWVVYFLSGEYAARLRANLLQSGLWQDEKDFQRILRRNIADSGKAVAELVPVWFRPVVPALQLVVRAGPLALVEDAERRERGVIYLTPHLGCFDAAALWVGQRRPITVLYRPPKMKALQPLIEAGRGRDRVRLAPANLGGVRLLLKALKRGEAVGILPDQVPGEGEGVWAEFFGRPAYTMTLVGRLVEATGATILMTAAVRLPDGAGYAIHFSEFNGLPAGISGPRALNMAIEKLVRLEPSQYLWSYNRYKVPAGAMPPPEGTDSHA
ncbi:MAG: lysophospholipid acyltransferase family protein [Prolixibacteraceae bacterium]|nr:lysophospholipid acyltransferase family protein [Burkholderiales bacterium]